jgi:hypothetical protein
MCLMFGSMQNSPSVENLQNKNKKLEINYTKK